MSGLRPGGRKLASAPILAATIGLFALSPLLASGSLGAGSVNNMLPFAAALAITAVGQTLVIQQGGIDLSVPGMVSLGAVVFTKHADGSDGAITTAILLVLVCGLAIGLLNGLVVTRLRVTPACSRSRAACRRARRRHGATSRSARRWASRTP